MEDDLDQGAFFAFEDFPEAQSPPGTPPATPPVPLRNTARGSVTGTARFVDIDGELVYLSDDDEPVPDPGPLPPLHRSPVIDLFAVDRTIASATTPNDGFTLTKCLNRVLELFPDVSHEYVQALYSEFDEAGDFEAIPGSARFDSIVERLLEAEHYPKQEKEAPPKKRKREISSSPSPENEWTHPDRNHNLGSRSTNDIRLILKSEFPEIPFAYINEQQAQHRFLFQTYVALAHAKDTFDPNRPAYRKGRPSSKYDEINNRVQGDGNEPVMQELRAARLRVQQIRDQQANAEAKKQAELENERRAKETGDTAECSVCFDDLPTNRQIHCAGTVAHFTCFECATNYIRSEIGQSRCRVLCTAGCGAGFAPRQLNLLSDEVLLAKLADLEQQKAIRDAGLEDLEECPFCDYKAEMPPIEENFEFRCMKPGCEKISCRRCKLISHIPISCAKHQETLAKDDQLNAIHKIEEAMTEALMRSCNRCKTRFIKEVGCNKMTCPNCSNLQCYVCSTTLKNYDHFDSNRPGDPRTTDAQSKKCPLFDNVEERHAKEVKEAEAAARAKVMKEVPEMDPSELTVKMSEAVIKAEADKIKRAASLHGGQAQGVQDYAVLGERHQPGVRIPQRFIDNGIDDFDEYMRMMRARLQREAAAREAAREEAMRNQGWNADPRVRAYENYRIAADRARMEARRVDRDQHALPRAFEPLEPDPLHVNPLDPAGNAANLWPPPLPLDIPNGRGVRVDEQADEALFPAPLNGIMGYDQLLALQQRDEQLYGHAFGPGFVERDRVFDRNRRQRQAQAMLAQPPHPPAPRARRGRTVNVAQHPGARG